MMIAVNIPLSLIFWPSSAFSFKQELKKELREHQKIAWEKQHLLGSATSLDPTAMSVDASIMWGEHGEGGVKSGSLRLPTSLIDISALLDSKEKQKEKEKHKKHKSTPSSSASSSSSSLSKVKVQHESSTSSIPYYEQKLKHHTPLPFKTPEKKVTNKASSIAILATTPPNTPPNTPHNIPSFTHHHSHHATPTPSSFSSRSAFQTSQLMFVFYSFFFK